MKFTHKKTGTTWRVLAYYDQSREFLMEREDGKEKLFVTVEAFEKVFRRFGEYDEKDLVP